MTEASSLPKQTARWRFAFNTAIVMLGTVLSRVLGLVREAILSRQFGTSSEIGVFGAVFAIPDLLYLIIIGGALGSALIPVFSRLNHEGETERAWELANTVLTIACLVFVLVAAGIAVFARPLLAFTVTRGYADNPELLNLAVHLLRLMLVQPLLLGLGGLMMALLQAFDRFGLPVIAANVYNVSIIVAAWLFAPRYRTDALAWGVVVGALLYFLILLHAVTRAGLRLRPSLNWRMREVRRVGQLLAPRLLGQGALQINIIVIASLISLLTAQAQAANRYAYQLLMLPHGIIALSLGTVLFPRLARLYAANELDELRDAAFSTLRLVLWLAVPAALLFAVLDVPIVRLIFQRGEFAADSLALTGRALFFYTPGVIGLAGAEILIRTFYAMEDTRTPVVVGVATIVINAALAWSLLRFVAADLGLIALSYSATNVLEFVILLFLLRRRLGSWGAVAPGRSLVALVVASAALAGTLALGVRIAAPYVPGITTASAYGRGADFFWLAGGVALIVAAGMGVYLVVGTLLRAPEVRQMWALVRRRA